MVLAASVPSWFVLRDLKRPNAKLPAYRFLADQGLEVFTPMKWHLVVHHGKRVREERPFMSDLLFAYATREQLDPYVEEVATLQYRYVRGAYCKPMVVGTEEMNRFIQAVRSSDSIQYYLPGELTPAMYGHQVCIIGGLLNGYEGRLLRVRGSKVKRLLVEIPNLIAAAVEVNPEYVLMK